jgi:putative sugar O-methyltransferase
MPLKVPQVKDDLQLLDLMISDMHAASDLYKPTNYWELYEQQFLPQLHSKGLHDFRRNKRMNVLNSFGATDVIVPYSRLTDLFLKSSTLRKFSRLVSLVYAGVELDDVRKLCYDFANLYGDKCGAKPLANFSASTVGNPEDIFEIKGQMYTTSLLYYYLQYAYCCQFINFDSIKSLMEIGSGSGKQVEVIKKLHPHLTFYVFDIAPQLYVCEQYLSALFSGSVVSYRQTRKMTAALSQNEEKIFVFGNWKLPELSNFGYDLFWNSASFQEMEPEVVLNYLKFVNEQAQYAFLHEAMNGKEVASRKGEHGVLKQTRIEHYKEGLSNFELKDMSESIFLPRQEGNYSTSFWNKKK